MPLYVRKNGQEAKEERDEAIKREKDRAEKRAKMDSGKKQKAVAEMANVREVRKGNREPPVSPGEGFMKPIYDPTTGYWKSYDETDDSLWKGWCVDRNEWLSSDDYERGKLFH